MAEEKTEKKEDLKKQLDSIAYELRQLHDKVERHSRNWVKAANTIMGDVGGKPGEAKHGKSIISVLIAMAVTLLLAGSVFATIPLLDLTTGDGANNGTFTVISDEAGTATLTVDAAAIATVSNDSGVVYCADGTFTNTLTVGGSLDIPAQSIASDDLPASMTDTTIFSNDAAVVYGANGTFTNGLVVDARAPVLSFNTATYVTEVGTITMGSNGKYTNDWTTAFSAAPIVVLTYGEAVSTNTAFTTLLSTTSGVFNGTASVLMNFNATGLK